MDPQRCKFAPNISDACLHGHLIVSSRHVDDARQRNGGHDSLIDMLFRLFMRILTGGPSRPSQFNLVGVVLHNSNHDVILLPVHLPVVHMGSPLRLSWMLDMFPWHSCVV